MKILIVVAFVTLFAVSLADDETTAAPSEETTVATEATTKQEDKTENHEDVVNDATNSIKEKMEQQLKKLEGQMSGMKDKINKLLDGAGGVPESVKNIVEGGLNKVTDLMGGGMKKMQEIINKAWDKSSEMIINGLQSGLNEFGKVQECIKKTGTNIKLPNNVVGTVRECINEQDTTVSSIYEKFGVGFKDIQQMVGTMPGDVSHCLGKLASLAGLVQGPICFTSMATKWASQGVQISADMVTAGLNTATTILSFGSNVVNCSNTKINGMIKEVTSGNIEVSKCMQEI